MQTITCVVRIRNQLAIIPALAKVIVELLRELEANELLARPCTLLNIKHAPFNEGAHAMMTINVGVKRDDSRIE